MKDSEQSVDFLCNGAEKYFTNTADIELKWLTKGVKYSRYVIGYPGITDLTQKDHLLILFGFERDRTQRIQVLLQYKTRGYNSIIL